MKILAINPNTTEAMTETVMLALRTHAGDALSLRERDGKSGNRGGGIACELCRCGRQCARGLGRISRQRRWHPDRVFRRPRRFGFAGSDRRSDLRLAEAAMSAASTRHSRFAVVTAGPCWAPMIDELAASCRIAGYLCTIAIDATGLSARSEPSVFQGKMQAAIDEAERAGADAILLGGAALAGSAHRYECTIPLLDCVELTVEAMKRGVYPRVKALRPPAVASTGLDADLADLLARPRM